MQNDIAIIILTKNNNKLLYKCLESIKLHTQNTYTIYICDTGSTEDNLQELKLKLIHTFTSANCKLLILPRYHFAQNHNTVIAEHVAEKYILLCNDDIEFDTPVVDKLFQMYTNRPNGNIKYGTMGCRLEFPSTHQIQHAGQIAYIDEHGFLQCTHRGYKSRGEFKTGPIVGNTAALMIIHKDIFISNDGFDITYTECWEDIQFNMRLILAGYTNWYCDDIVAIHHESATRLQDPPARFRLQYDYTYKLKPWFDRLDYQSKQRILKLYK